jgi:sugar phosphate isomerase/epimerase
MTGLAAAGTLPLTTALAQRPEGGVEKNHLPFQKTMVALPVAGTPGTLSNTQHELSRHEPGRKGGARLKTSLNAYSFDTSLRDGSMNLELLLDFCAGQGFDGVDLTGYYFPGYPAVPGDEYIYRIKRKAFLLGLDISGTGVRNDFTYTDGEKRKEDVTLVKNWIVSAAKLGAPVIRIFAGKQDTAGYTWEQVADWMVKDMTECVTFGKEHGVLVAVQNHNDFIKSADQALTILKMVDSPWFGLILDTGSFRTGDPYAEIAIAAPFAVNWQVKENIFVAGEQVRTDLRRIVKIVRASGYRGYLPIETLGPGDPKVKVPALLEELWAALREPA